MALKLAPDQPDESIRKCVNIFQIICEYNIANWLLELPDKSLKFVSRKTNFEKKKNTCTSCKKLSTKYMCIDLQILKTILQFFLQNIDTFIE